MDANNLPANTIGQKKDRETIHLGKALQGSSMGCTLESVIDLNRDRRKSVKRFVEAKPKEHGLFMCDLRTGIDIAGFDNPYDEINNILLQVYELLFAGWQCQFDLMDTTNKLENYRNQENLERAAAGTFLNPDEVERIKAMFQDEAKFTYYLRSLYALRYVARKVVTQSGTVDKQSPMFPVLKLSDNLIKCLYRQEYDYTSSQSSGL